MTDSVGRPKNKTERKVINTSLDLKIIDVLRQYSEETGIPMNRLIENAVREKYGTNQGEEKL